MENYERNQESYLKDLEEMDMVKDFDYTLMNYDRYWM